MYLFDPISNYCERTSPALWAEPLNAVSNIAFFVAAWLLYKSYKSGQCNGREVALLIFLVALIGLGSTLFHTFANKLTEIADVVPIGLFVFYYLWVTLRRLVELSRLQTGITLVVFALAAIAMSHIPNPYRFNGSISYFPCWVAIFIVGWYLKHRQHPSAPLIMRAACWLALSLTFRSLDFVLCAALPIGTHFLWHSINGLVLYLLTSAIIRVQCR